jgi:D-sedoheptulose 7-phosphate isomerase
MDLDSFFAAEMAEHAEVQRATAARLAEPFRRLVGACVSSLRAGGKILFFGNGGSAADAQHLATELTVRYKKDRAAVAALALTTDTSALTAIGNDFGFERLFERQIEALGRPGDVAIGISTSGKSENVIRALRTAKKIGAVAAALSGGDGGRLPGLADPLLIVPSKTTARIQEMHIALGQMLCGALEIELGLVGDCALGARGPSRAKSAS